MSDLKFALKAIAVTAITCGFSAQASAKEIGSKKARDFPASVHKPMPGEIIVKCAGIAKKGGNHCGANGHECRHKAKKDFDKNEWIYVRKEVCDATPGRVVGKKRVIKG